MEFLLILITINIFVFVLPYAYDFSGGGGNEASHLKLLSMGWKNKDTISQNEYYRLLTAGFLHSGFIHLALNMYFLWTFGSYFILAYDPFWFLLIYILSGLGSSLISLKFNPNPSVGASGSLFGLLGAVFLLSLALGSQQMIYSVLLSLVINYTIGTVNPRIDNWGHLGGFITGLLVSLIPIALKFYI